MRWTRTAAAGLLAASLGGCFPYQAGSYRKGLVPFEGQHASRGCLDIGMRAGLDPAADGPVVELLLGNRCNEAVWIDVPAVDVTAYGDHGAGKRVPMFDPRHELKVALLGGREVVSERIELVAPLETVRICALLDGLTRPTKPGPPQLLCAPVEDNA